MTTPSEFDHQDDNRFVDAEPLPYAGATCLAFRVRRYGKWHFLKRLKPEYANDPRYVAAMEKEFETAYRLDHPALPRYMEHGHDYILMEFIDGTTLTDFLEEHPEVFEEETSLHTFCLQLLQALQYLHAHQILHLDLKPDNILMTRIGHEVRLVDFGFCYTDSNPFTTGHTAQFAAPEQLEGVDEMSFTPATDLYTFGRVLQFISATTSLPPLYRKVMDKCLAQRPSLRYQSAQEVIDALTPKKSSKKGIMAFAILAALIVVGWWWANNDSSMPSPAGAIDSLTSSEAPVKPDTVRASAPLDEPNDQETRPNHEVEESPIVQQSSVANNSSYIRSLEEEIQKKVSPTEGKNPQLDAAIISACAPALQFVETFRDSVYGGSTVMLNWQMSMKKCREQIPSIQQKLQHEFDGQVPSKEVSVAVERYIDAEISTILKQMLVNAYLKGSFSRL